MREFNENNFNEKWSEFWTIMDEVGCTHIFDKNVLYNSLKNAPAAIQEDSGLAYPGALLDHIILATKISERLHKLISGTFSIDIFSLKKVCLLMHLSKIDMFMPNDNDWEISKRGMNYKFTTIDGCLKAGERSALTFLNLGGKLTPIEYEAMKAMDKDPEEFQNSKYFLNIMTVIIRQANDLAYLIAKEKNK